ncbi:MAG: rod shape-determining protein MreC [Acidobacteria bacterium]|nr:rod shape-determining protein MreC [Acidobacteriota bacterium]
MLDPNFRESVRPDHPPSREGPVVLQAFVARHRAFFILMAVLVAQLLLLSLQITRSNKVRLIQVWAVVVFDPFERALHGAVDASTEAWRTYRDLWRAHQQTYELQVQLVEARSQIQQLSERAAEAERLRELLEFKQRLPFRTVAAEVIAASPGEGSKAIYIDKGSSAGLAPDLAVITPAGVVGKVLVVFPYSAQVLLITDPSSGAGCILQRTRAQGILKGSPTNVCEVQYVVNEDPVEVGETVLTSGLDRIYPKGLPVGTVVRTQVGDVYREITVKPSASLDRLETVLVVLGSPPRELHALGDPPAR